ncbi:MAG: tRNA lysidine(34) synthetase TilS [Chloroflexi bacterium]|nr:tRNA lysidine(34) synthetase TilS [Chloroflexota bacterium]
MAQPKKLQDFLVDAKVPRAWRDRVPLVTGDGRILWVVGWRLGEAAKVTPGTKRVLILKFEPRPGS